MSEQNKALVQRFYDEVVTQGNIDLIDELVSEDLVEHEEFPGLEPNREGVKAFFRMIRAAFPDLTFTIEDILAEGDRVAARVTVRGTQKGEWMGIPPSDRHIEVTAIDFLRFEDGKAVEHWGVMDAMAMMEQLGALPVPG